MPKRQQTENSSLQEALAASFKTATPVAINEKSTETKQATPVEKEVAPGSNPDVELKRTTVVFTQVEQAQIDKILGLLLKSKRHRGGFSDAVKIALRLCPLDQEKIGQAWDEARAMDRRTKKFTRTYNVNS